MLDKDVYTQVYAAFRGVDFTNNPVNCDISRSPDAVNIIPDGGGYPSKRLGWRVLYEFKNENINGLHYAVFADKQPYIAVHRGERLTLLKPLSDGSYQAFLTFVDTIADNRSVAFCHNDRLYLLDGENYKVVYYDDAAGQYLLKDVSEYATIPTTQIAGFYEMISEADKENNIEAQYEWRYGEFAEANLLTSRRINTFAGDALHKVFYCDIDNLLIDKVEIYIPKSASTEVGAQVKVINYANIRQSPSMSGVILGVAQAGETFPLFATVGKWHRISYSGQTAYVHLSRVEVIEGTKDIENETEWEETTNYTYEEDEERKKTKITFATAPDMHPAGAGIANIRVTGTVTESAAYEATGGDTHELPTNALKVISVTVNGAKSEYSTSVSDGVITVTITEPPSESDEIIISYLRSSSKNEGLISKCTLVGTFGAYNNDIYFLSGNPNYPNRDWASDNGDPTYFPQEGWTDIGSKANPIMGYLQYQSSQLIIKADNNSEAEIYRRTAEELDDGIVIFPVRQGFMGRGAISRYALAHLRDDPLFLAREGVYSFISTDLSSKYSVQDRSFLIFPKLSEEQLSKAVACAWGNYYLLCFPNGHCYVADATQRTAPSTTEQQGYEWFFWDNIPAKCFLEYDGNLLFGTDKGCICKFNTDITGEEKYLDAGQLASGEWSAFMPIKSKWATKCDQLGSTALRKFINRRGFILRVHPEAGSTSLAIVTDSDRVVVKLDAYTNGNNETTVDYDVIDLNATNGSPHVAVNCPIKRFGYIQLIIQNDSPSESLGIYSIQFQYRYGRYIK